MASTLRVQAEHEPPSQSDTSASCAPQDGRGARSCYAAVRRV